MSVWRAAIIIALIAFGSAGLLAFVSRTPSEVRNIDESSQSTDPSLGARFAPEQIARHGAYRGPVYLSFFLGLAVEVTVLVVLALGPLPQLVSRLEGARGGVVLNAAVLGAVVAVVLGAAALPLSFVRGYVMQHAWGLSTQNLLQWFDDLGRGLLVTGVIAAVSTAAFFVVVRWQPRVWWILGWLTFTVLTALLVFIYPVVIAPLFNKFTPIEDSGLDAKIRAMATEAGVDVDEVLVADASRRTTAENAYVAGLGQTKRVVVYDTLLEGGGEDETLFVVAHELGHEKENHVLKNIGLSAIGLFVAFAALAWLSHRSALFQWAGASSISDLRALPVLLIFGIVAGVLTLPIQNAVSRNFESRADDIAIELTENPDVAVRSFRRLAFSNIADLDPPAPAVFMFFTHPPTAERIEDSLRAGSP